MIPLYREWFVNEVHINFFFQNCVLHYSGARSARSESQYLSKMVVITISHLAEKIWFIMEFSIPKTSRKTVVLW